MREPPGNQSAEEFFIDIILQRHARKLLSQCRLLDLGTFAAQLDFHMVTWLKKEVNRAAKVDNSVFALKKIHGDFSWPFPVLLTAVYDDLIKRKHSQESSASSGVRIGNNNPPSLSSTDTNVVDDKLRALRIDVNAASKANNPAISDSGYISHANNDQSQNGDEQHLLSEQTIHAMLKPLSFRGEQKAGLSIKHEILIDDFSEDMSIMSDDVASLVSPDEQITSVSNQDWSSLQGHSSLSQESVAKGPINSEIQLRYKFKSLIRNNKSKRLNRLSPDTYFKLSWKPTAWKLQLLFQLF